MSGQVNLQTVLDTMVMQESQPSLEVLERWSKRFPQFKSELAEFFNGWISLNELQGEPEDAPVDEQAIIDKTVTHMMGVLEQQGRILPDRSAEPLNEIQQLVLEAVRQLGTDAYNVTIAKQIQETAGRRLPAGLLFLALRQLEERCLVSVRETVDAEDREGTARNYYTTTLSGDRALALARVPAKVVADNALGDLA